MKKRMIFFLVFILLFFITIPLASAKSFGWGFKRNQNHKVPDIGKYQQEIEGTNSYYVDKNKKNIYLTFDAGYDNGVLPKILDVLKSKNVKSTFFVTGDFVTRESDLLKRIVDEDHIIGNHTWGHKDITTLSKDELKVQLEKVEDAFFKLTNKPMEKIFRPPAGKFNKESLNNIKELGYATFFWSIAYVDWNTDGQKGRDYAYNNVLSQLHDGAIILMHTVSQDNCDALPDLIDEIRNQGYEIKNLNEFPLDNV